MAAIRQIQAKYDAREDRLLLRIGTEAIDAPGIWLTRRYVELLLKALKQFADADPDVGGLVVPSDREEVKAWKAKKILDQANFDTPFAAEQEQTEAHVSHPLAFKLTYKIKDEQLHLTLLPQLGEGINLVVNQEIAVSLTAILLSAAGKANWRLAEDKDPLGTHNLRVVN